MKFTVSSSALLRQLSTLSGVLNANVALPILDCFLFQINKNELRISASDLETTMVASMPVDSKDALDIAIPARLLLETLKTFPEQPLTFNIDAKKLAIEIQSQNGKYKLTGRESGDFPKLAEVESPSSFEMDGAILLKAISKTIFAVGTDELRPVMCGVFVKLDKDGITFVATDAHKLVRYRRADIKSDKEASYIIPKKPLNLLKSVIGTGAVTSEYNATNASFESGNVRIVTRLIDGKYPNYDAVIPKNNPNKLTIDREAFLNSIRRVAVFSNKNTHQVKLSIKKGKLSILAEDLDFSNEANEELKCDYKGDDLEIGFNSKFLNEILGSMEGEEVVFELGNPNIAGIIKPTDKEDVLMLVMPVMLNT